MDVNYLFNNFNKMNFKYIHLLVTNIGFILMFVLLGVFFNVDSLAPEDLDISNFKESFVLILILAGLIAPLFEELLHRSYVTNRRNVYISIFLLILYFLAMSDFSLLRVLLFSFYFFFLISLVISKNIYKNSNYLLVATSIFFTVFHIFKYDSFENYSFFASVYNFFPQLVSGIILYFVHKKYGFLVGVLHHGLLNVILLSIIYIILSFMEKEISASLIAE